MMVEVELFTRRNELVSSPKGESINSQLSDGGLNAYLYVTIGSEALW